MNKIPSSVSLNSITFSPRKLLTDRRILMYTFNTPNRNGKTAIVIMKNPSESFKGLRRDKLNLNYHDTFIDRSTQNAMKLLEQLGYSRAIHLNIFSFFSGKPGALNHRYGFVKKGNMQTNPICWTKWINLSANMKVLKKTLKNNKNADVICAWGGTSDGPEAGYYEYFVKKILTTLKGLHKGILYQVIQKGDTPKILSEVEYPLHPQKWIETAKLELSPP